MRAVIYARQSKTREGSESLDTQVAVCRDAAERFGYEVVAELVEPPSTSGYKNRGANRAKFKELLRGFTDRRWDMVMAYKTDRLSRGGGPGWAPLLEAIESAGLNVDRSVATPHGFVSEFEIGIRAAMDREESKKTSERISDVAARNAAAGKPYGSVRSYGYADHLYRSIKQDEADILREMAKRFLAGQSFYDITYWLNAEGHTTTNGKRWMTRGVKRTLQHKVYIGVREYNGIDYAGTWEPIFDLAMWERLQLAIKLREGPHAGKVYSKKYLLTGLVVCGVCGRHLVGTTRWDNKAMDKDGKPVKRPAYHCRKKGYYLPEGGCGSIRRGSEALDHYVRECVFARLDSDCLGKLLSEQADNGQVKALVDKQHLQRERLAELDEMLGAGEMTRQSYVRASQAARTELEAIETELASLTSQSAVRIEPGQSLREAWDKNPQSWRQALLGLVIKEIRVNSTRKSTGWYKAGDRMFRFNPSSVQIVWQDGLVS